MKTIVMALCLIPTVAFGGEIVKLNFKDKTSMCGAYELKGNQYCKSVGGGEMCWQKTDIVSVEKADDCEEGGFAGGSSGVSTNRASGGSTNSPAIPKISPNASAEERVVKLTPEQKAEMERKHDKWNREAAEREREARTPKQRW